MTRPPTESLPEIFQRTAPPGPRPDCPASERIWAAVTGALPESDVTEIVDHTAECGECAEAWRLALGMEREEPVAGVRRPLRWLGAAVGVGVAAAAALVLLVRQPEREHFREGGAPRIVSLSPGVQPRATIDLRWSAVPGAERYTVTVMTPELVLVHRSDGLTTPEIHLQPGTLSAGRFLWSVRVFLSDGRVVDSEAFSLEAR